MGPCKWTVMVFLAAAVVLAAATGVVAHPTAVVAETTPQPGGCFVDGHVFKVGEIYNTGPDPCNTYTCHATGNIYGLACPYFLAGDGCEIVPGNQSAVYPHCCPVESCSENLINVDTRR